MGKWVNTIKSLIRPFLIIWGCVVYGICLSRGEGVPAPLNILISAIIVEYFGERAVLRLKEKI